MQDKTWWPGTGVLGAVEGSMGGNVDGIEESVGLLEISP